jgi:predicted dehydrogenase
MSNQTVNCAVVGAGWWATSAHIPAILKHPNARLLAIQKRNREEAEAVANEFGVPHACVNIEEVLDIEGLDAVIISSTPNMHYQQAKTMLKRGLHVLIEKPMTITLKEAEELVCLAEMARVHFLISCPHLYTAHVVEARKRIMAGELGNIKMVSMLMTNFSGGLYKGKSVSEIMSEQCNMVESTTKPFLEPRRDSYSDPAVAGGGQIYCQVSHAALCLNFLTSLEPVEVFARFDNAGLAVDVYDTLNLKMDNGALVSIASTGATMPSERNFETRIYGERGMIFLEQWKGTAVFHDEKGGVESLPPLHEEEIYPSEAPVVNLIDVILGNAPNGSPAHHGLSSMKIIEAACRSVSSKKNVILNKNN